MFSRTQLFTPWRAYLQLMRVDRPIGTLLLLWPTLWALWLAAEGLPPLKETLVFIAGVVVMRSAGCVINDIADRKFDGNVKRTAMRPLVSGALNTRQALLLFGVLIFIALLLVLQLNLFSLKLSTFALVLAALYPFMKRVTHLPQLFLALAFSWAIPMAYAAVRGNLDGELLWLMGANIAWVIAYDTMYAMVDRDDDLRIGIKSTAILFGRYDKAAIGLLQIITLASLASLGYLKQLNGAFYIGLVLAAVFFVYQQWLIQTRQREQCFRAFLNNNYVGLCLFLGLSLAYISA